MNGKRCGMRQRGISLVEILVAMTISLIILAGVTQSLITNQRNSEWSDGVAYIQENARYASDLLANDIRMAGYFGCAVKGAGVVNSITPGSNDFAYQIDQGIEGWAAGATLPTGLVPAGNLWSSVSGHSQPDLFLVRHAVGGLDLAVESHGLQSPKFTINRSVPLKAGDPAVVVDQHCRDVTLAQVNSVSGDDVTFGTAGSVSPGNASNDFDGFKYGPGSTVMRYQTDAYYIGMSSADATVPALYRVSLINDAGTIKLEREELVSGVEDMQLYYGVDTDADGSADRYATAAGVAADQWADVVSVRIELALRSYNEVLKVSKSQTPIPSGHTYDDRFLRQYVTTTVRLRNVGLGGA